MKRYSLIKHIIEKVGYPKNNSGMAVTINTLKFGQVEFISLDNLDIPIYQYTPRNNVEKIGNKKIMTRLMGGYLDTSKEMETLFLDNVAHIVDVHKHAIMTQLNTIDNMMNELREIIDK